ncbi:undecaprenyl-phosphate galactose phosphotransferase WbaP [Thermosediminibacter oceani]|uniref:Undecaprenyl-phosphate galactose phosphotransferase, WbaP n=1 Tax=Thermosediminibacter oceani (strain ATCC BAA-1034 / DSM 16646 / JW/IW-1228P) TaxID=555079 RepID=D9S1K0_THEOJ|nr:undecaprenyl-phosphate galactose phosphotransferase WbaP [Thermosediminibacter oceani]ADL07277.1 Undecaprenyl-phosphate galactose phosphotransferase, WbaP [Thermosediminibacter oceani DSM 16646]
MNNSQVEIRKTGRQIVTQSNEAAIALRPAPTLDLAHAFWGAFEITLLAAMDFLGIATSFMLALLIRIRTLPALSPLYSSMVPDRLINNFWWLTGIVLGILAFEGLYTARYPFWRELQRLVKGITLAFLVVFTVIFMAKLSSEVSRTVLTLTYLFCLLILPFCRYTGKTILSRLGLWRRKVVILGAGKTGELVAKIFSSDSYLGYEVVGFLEDDPGKKHKTFAIKKDTILKVLGNFSDAQEVMQRLGVRHLVVAAPGMPSQELVKLVNRLQREAASVLVIPDLLGVPVSSAEIDYFFEEQMLGFRVRNNLSDPVNMVLKRTFDLVVGSIALLVSAPIMAIIALAIKLDSPGPVIFAHKRIGRWGKEFKCYKFRTMYLNNEEILQRYLASNPAAKEEWEKYAKLKGYDPRVTRVGRFLRKLSLDELPQIFNVLKGEMSLVGPRPYLPRERFRMDNFAETILLARPGITGLWQISGRNEIDFEGRLNLESWYVRNWSLWLDIVILIRTVGVVLARRGAY